MLIPGQWIDSKVTFPNAFADPTDVDNVAFTGIVNLVGTCLRKFFTKLEAVIFSKVPTNYG